MIHLILYILCSYVMKGISHGDIFPQTCQLVENLFNEK